MRGYRYAEIGFEAPERWTDLSVIEFAQSAEDGAPTVTLTRESPLGRGDLAAHARRLVDANAKTVKDHAIVDSGAAEIDGAPAYRFDLRFTSVPQRIAVQQRQYYFATPSGDVALLSFTCAVDAFVAHASLFESIARSVRREPVDT